MIERKTIMSYEIRAFCRPVCDQPGCDDMVEDMDVNWFSDTGYAEDVAAEWDWQTIGDDVMQIGRASCRERV